MLVYKKKYIIEKGGWPFRNNFACYVIIFHLLNFIECASSEEDGRWMKCGLSFRHLKFCIFSMMALMEKKY